ncbi:MAG: DEAD/DEAH box helicase [Gammaproteobacteria bacterium]|nr:DEAD/DEAH box helicase [Gammaproteobacteria bacterium]
MEEFDSVYEKLVLNDMEEQLPGNAVNEIKRLSDNDVQRLVGYASLLSVSDEYFDKSRSYEIITRLIEIKKTSDILLLKASDMLLSRLGNFPGRKLLRERYLKGDLIGSPIGVSLEKIAREAENTVEQGFGDNELLTDFQYLLYHAMTEGKFVSVSAPTSAGKSYVLNLALRKRIMSGDKESIIYIVPTRALISEVTQRIRESLRKVNLNGVVIRTAPFPITKENVSKGIIYVLTQERLSSLLYSDEPGLWVTSLIIDEAHEIQKRKRGIILQNSVDAILTKFPNIPVLFASPLISNPDYFVELFGMGGMTKTESLIERVSPVAQNIILVEKVKGNTKRAKFSLVGREKVVDLGERELDFKYRGSKTQLKSEIAISLTRDNEATIVFANDPGDTEKIAKSLSENLEENILDDDIESFIEFIKTEIHPEYPLIACLKKGVAFHYGYMPSIVRSGVEALFKDEKIKYICCTSTLLQGVNLPAKNILIDNPKSGDKPMSRPDFLNLSGRAGRLLKEFHGNIWCINPMEWEEPIYQGEQLEEICSAIDLVMKDGGSSLDDLLEGRIKKASEIENAEVAFSRIYHELSESGRDALIEKYGLESNLVNLDKTLKHCESLNISLPYSILEMNKSLRPDHLEEIYKRLVGEVFLLEMAPLHPFKAGAKSRFELILNVISESFEWNIHNNYVPLLSYIAYEWVKGTSLKKLLSNRVSYIQSSEPNKDVSPIIRGVLKIIEHDIRFKLEKYFSAYNDVLKLVFEEKNIAPQDCKMEPYHIYLEFGASDKTSLNLMALGLSRFTALHLTKYAMFKSIDSDEPEEYLRALSSLALREGSSIPTVCLNEVRELVGN